MEVVGGVLASKGVPGALVLERLRVAVVETTKNKKTPKELQVPRWASKPSVLVSVWRLWLGSSTVRALIQKPLRSGHGP